MPTKHFPFMGTHFKTSWDSKGIAFPFGSGFPIGAGSTLLAGDSRGMANSFGSGSSNRGESALLAGESKGDSVPMAVVSKGGSAALAGGIQWRAVPSVAGRIQ